MVSLPADFIDPEMVMRRLDHLGSVGRLPEGGLYRGVYTTAWQEGVALLRGWMERGGLDTRVDPVGNLGGRVPGTVSSRVVASGSHLDTVRGGGIYDGALGVVAALAAVEGLLRRFGPPMKTLEVLAICEEEGSRFRCNFWGSRALCGRIQTGEAEALFDAGGISLSEAMRGCGLDPNLIPSACRRDLDAFVEMHIEQGPILDGVGCPLGVVDRITGMCQLEVTIVGRQDHAGTTPMDLRRDAMVGAAEMIAGISEVALAMGRPAVATIGLVHAAPGAVNVVPGSVTFTVDLRHSLPERLRELRAGVEGVLRDVASRRMLGIQVDSLMDHEPVVLDSVLRSVTEDSASAEGLDYRVMPSGAGHDSQIIAQSFPATMLFVPSRDGRSHSPEEYTPLDSIVAGVRVLAQILYRLAY